MSYSSENRDVVDKMTGLFAKNNIDCFIAPDDIPAGSVYADAINKAIKHCSCLVLLLTKEAMSSSWVAKEVERAINYKRVVIPVKLEDLVLNDEFEFYISTAQMISVNDIDKADEDVQRLLSTVKAHTTASDYEKHTLATAILKDVNGGGLYTPPVTQNPATSKPNQSAKSKLNNKAVIIISVCSLVLVVGLILTLVITSLAQNNGKDDTQVGGTNTPAAITDTQAPTGNVESDSTQAETEAETETVINEIPERHEDKVTALEYANSLARTNKTIRVKVGEYATPGAAGVWSNVKIYSQNTNIAVGEPPLVKGVSKGETYVIVEAATGMADAYYIIVE